MGHTDMSASTPKKNSDPENFTTLNRSQVKAVWDAIRALDPDERPKQVLHAFDLAILNLRQDTGEVMLTRDQLSEEIGCSPDHVSRVMGTLARMGVIRRERHRVKGMRGPGVASYFVNPHVAWNGSLSALKTEMMKTKIPAL